MIRKRLKKVFADRFEPSPYIPDWKSILGKERRRWRAARKAADGPLVLMATGAGDSPPAVTVESTLAVALTLRGARVHLLLCDEALPACDVAHIRRYRDAAQFLAEGPQRRLCGDCYAQGRYVMEPLGLPLHRYSKVIASGAYERAAEEAASVPFDEIATYRSNGLAVGEHALAGALRFVTRGDFEDEPLGPEIARQYLAGALLTADGLQQLFETEGFEHAVFHHGIYVPQGIVGEVARRQGVHVVNWGVGYRNRSFLFSHEQSYHHTLLDEPHSTWENVPWNEALEEQVMTYLESRAHGSKDWIRYHDRPIERPEEIEAEIGVDFSRPCVALLTNVLWDAQLHYQGNAFPNLLAWICETIRYFEKRPDIQLIIRVHPAEVKGTLRSRQPIEPEIRRLIPDMPANVFIISAESRIGTYAVAEHCDAALIYGTKMGVELAARGIPVVVAGEAWARNKGFTLDADTADEYFRHLDRLPLGERMTPEARRRARMYAYHFFFRRMIPFGFMTPTGVHPPFRLGIESLDDLLPGRDPGFDTVCEGILNGTEFVYPAELHDGAFPMTPALAG